MLLVGLTRPVRPQTPRQVRIQVGVVELLLAQLLGTPVADLLLLGHLDIEIPLHDLSKPVGAAAQDRSAQVADIEAYGIGAVGVHEPSQLKACIEDDPLSLLYIKEMRHGAEAALDLVEVNEVGALLIAQADESYSAFFRVQAGGLKVECCRSSTALLQSRDQGLLA